jgi:hypothetical protein
VTPSEIHRNFCGLVVVTDLVPEVTEDLSLVVLDSHCGLLEDQHSIGLLVVNWEDIWESEAGVRVPRGDEVGEETCGVEGELDLIGGGLIEERHSISEDIELEWELRAVAHIADTEPIVRSPAIEGHHMIETVGVGGDILRAEGFVVSASGVSQGAIEEEISGQGVQSGATIVGIWDHVEGIQSGELLEDGATKDTEQDGFIGSLVEWFGEELIDKELTLIEHSAREDGHLLHSSSSESIKGLLFDSAPWLDHRAEGEEVDEKVVEVELHGVLLSIQDLLGGLGSHAGNVITVAAEICEDIIGIGGG